MTATVSPYGFDLQSLPNAAANGAIDLDPGMLEGTGRMLLAQSLVRRQTTATGSVIDSPNNCIDIRGWLSQGWTIQQIRAQAGAIKAECLKDERVTDCQVQLTLLPNPGGAAGTNILQIVESFQSSYGPFTMTLSVQNLTVAVLISNQGTFGQ